MKLNSQNFNERITATSIFFENALGDPEMLSGFENHGYTAEKLGEGKTVLDVVQQKQITKNTAHAAKHAATQIFRTNRQAAHKCFMRLVGFSNVAFSADKTCGHWYKTGRNPGWSATGSGHKSGGKCTRSKRWQSTTIHQRTKY